VRLRIVGGSGAFPANGQACSGYLVDHANHRLLIDPGYGVATTLGEDPVAIDAVYVSHGHPDHYADLHPLLRARVLEHGDVDPLTIYAPPGAVDRILELDGLNELAGAFRLSTFEPGDAFSIGPFHAQTYSLPHFVPNAGVRLSAGGRVLAYTGDSGPAPEVAVMAAEADVLLAEATYPAMVPERFRPYLSTAVDSAKAAAEAGVTCLILTHLWPGTDRERVLETASEHFRGATEVASPGHVVECR